MENSNFANSTGINDPDNYSTVRDVLIMSRYLIEEHQNITTILLRKNLPGIEQVAILLLKVIETHFI